MGCDIHAMIERNCSPEPRLQKRWINAGDPQLWRNYSMFYALAGVRGHGNDQPMIAGPRGCPEDCCQVFSAWLKDWEYDAHSTSWVTLAEVKAYEWPTTLEWWRDAWGELTKNLEAAKRDGDTDDDIRMVFFFDN